MGRLLKFCNIRLVCTQKYFCYTHGIKIFIFIIINLLMILKKIEIVEQRVVNIELVSQFFFFNISFVCYYLF